MPSIFPVTATSDTSVSFMLPDTVSTVIELSDSSAVKLPFTLPTDTAPPVARDKSTFPSTVPRLMSPLIASARTFPLAETMSRPVALATFVVPFTVETFTLPAPSMSRLAAVSADMSAMPRAFIVPTTSLAVIEPVTFEASSEPRLVALVTFPPIFSSVAAPATLSIFTSPAMFFAVTSEFAFAMSTLPAVSTSAFPVTVSVTFTSPPILWASRVPFMLSKDTSPVMSLTTTLPVVATEREAAFCTPREPVDPILTLFAPSISVTVAEFISTS